MVNRECISPRGPALKWGRVWPFGSSWVAPLVTLGDRPPQVEGNGGGLNYSAWTWAALGLLMSPDTLCESPSNPLPRTSTLTMPVAPCASWVTRAVQSDKKKQTKKQVTRKHHYQVHTACVCMCKRKRCVQKWRWFDILLLKYFFLIPGLHNKGGWKCKIKSTFFKKVSICLFKQWTSINHVSYGWSYLIQRSFIGVFRKTCLKTIILSEIMFGDSSSVELHSLFFCIFFRTKGLVFDQLALMVYYVHKRIFT